MKDTKFRSRTPWVEKMNKPSHPVIKEAPESWISRYGGSRMLIPTPRLIEKMIMKIPEGRLMSVSKLREKMARKYGADFSCPLTTGIFLRFFRNM